MDIETALDEFIADEVPRTLILQGTWGRGKTHLWKTRWRKYYEDQVKIKLKPRRYAYVSLFGLNSISEVKVALGLASLESYPDPVPAESQSRFRRMWKGAPRLSTEVSVEIPSIGLGTKQLAQVFAHSRAKKMLACLDDIERRGKDLSIRDVLGLVSDLNSQRECSVVVILNDASLGEDQKEWDANREKVFTRHLTFAPTSSQCVSLVIPEDQPSPLLTHVRKALIDLDLTNIRIAERVRGFAQEVIDTLAGRPLHDVTQRKIARSLSILTYCHMAQGEGAPGIKFAFSYGAFSSYLRNQKEDVPEQEKSWGQLLDNFQAYLDHPLDKVLGELVVQGHVEGERLLATIDEFEHGAVSEEVKEAFHSVWDLWRLTFENNREEVVREFLARFPPAASSMSPTNADATFQLLRSFGEGAHADRLIEEWLTHRVGERSKELNPEYLNEFERLKDLTFIARTSEAFAQAGEHLPPFGDAILKLGLRQGHNPEDIEAIAAATPDEIAQFLLANTGRQLVMGVKATLEIGGSEVYDQAVERLRQALLALAARSPYEADRIRRAYNVVSCEPQGDESE